MSHPTNPVVVVGYDGGPGGQAALQYAIGRFGRASRLCVVCVAEPDLARPAVQGLTAESPSEAVTSERAARRILDALVLEDADSLSVERVVASGSVAPALCAAADERDAAEIIVGPARGFPVVGGHRRVVDLLLARAACPVVVVPRNGVAASAGA